MKRVTEKLKPYTSKIKVPAKVKEQINRLKPQKQFSLEHIPFLKKIVNTISMYLEKGEGEKVRTFRLVMVLIWINLLAIFILSTVRLSHVLNPLQFLSIQPVDKRPEITLFFPGSIEELHEKSDSTEKTRIVELHQKTQYDDDYKSPGRDKRILNNARMIINQLASPPDNIRGVRAIKDETIVKTVWFFNGRLLVHIDRARLRLMNDQQQKLTVTCIQKSLQANLGAFTEIQVLVQ